MPHLYFTLLLVTPRISKSRRWLVAPESWRVAQVVVREVTRPLSIGGTVWPARLGNDYIATCASARVLNVCALNISCLRSYSIQYLLYYCVFI